jgi:hypothetical protein
MITEAIIRAAYRRVAAGDKRIVPAISAGSDPAGAAARRRHRDMPEP